MADNVPKHNKNIVALTELLSDAVSGADNGVKASTDGNKFSSTFREQCMADGYSWLVSEVYRLRNQEAQLLVSGAVVSYTLAQVTAGIAVPGDYLHPLIAVRTTASTPPYRYMPPNMKAQADMDNLPDAKRVFTVYGNKLYSYTRSGGNLTADNSVNVDLYYFKAERINYSTGALIAANTTDSRSSDITLESCWHIACVYYAASLAGMKEGSSDWQAKSIAWNATAKNIVKDIIGVTNAEA